MAEYLHPGVFVNETASANAPIQGAGTSTAGFIGYAERGPANKAVYVTSWTDYVTKFAFGTASPFLANANLAYSVYGYFQNGGTKAYIVRAASATAKKASGKIDDGNGTPVDVIRFEALDEGVWGNGLKVNVTKVGSTSTYDVTVKLNGTIVSTYKAVTFVSTDADNFIEYVINGVDKYISVTFVGGTPAVAQLGVDVSLSLGADGVQDATDSTLTAALDAFNVVRANLLVCPESQSTAVNQALYAYADKTLSFAICDGTSNSTVESIKTQRDSLNSANAALYFPWIKVADPIGKGVDKTRFVPVAGHIAGVYARTDGQRGVFKAPAGVDADVRGAIECKVVVDDVTQDLLNPVGINVVRPLSGAGIVVWGSRTLSANPAQRYVPVKRSMLYLRESLQNGTRWAVFEPNNEALWAKINASMTGFLLGEYANGMFKGTKAEDAFFVKCDAELNPQSEIDAGKVHATAGVAIVKPGEFIIIDIGQWNGN